MKEEADRQALTLTKRWVDKHKGNTLFNIALLQRFPLATQCIVILTGLEYSALVERPYDSHASG